MDMDYVMRHISSILGRITVLEKTVESLSGTLDVQQAAHRAEVERMIQVATIRHNQEMTAINANMQEVARMLNELESGWAEFRHNVRNG